MYDIIHPNNYDDKVFAIVLNNNDIQSVTECADNNNMIYISNKNKSGFRMSKVDAIKMINIFLVANTPYTVLFNNNKAALFDKEDIKKGAILVNENNDPLMTVLHTVSAQIYLTLKDKK